MDRPMRLAWKYSWNVFQVCWKMNLFLAVYNFFIFCFVCFFFCFFLCHIFEYFNNFVLKHWLFAFIFQNSYLSTWGSCRLGSASIVFFLQTSFDQLYNKIILCAWTCPIFSACHPWYIMCLWRKHDGCFNNGYHRFHNCFVCGILLSLLTCQFWNVSAWTCVCVCVSRVKHLLRQLLPQATTSLSPLPAHSPKCELLWLLTMHSSRAPLKWPMPHTTRCEAKQSSLQTYTHHFQDENVGRLATLNKPSYLDKVEWKQPTYLDHINSRIKLLI